MSLELKDEKVFVKCDAETCGKTRRGMPASWIATILYMPCAGAGKASLTFHACGTGCASSLFRKLASLVEESQKPRKKPKKVA